MRWEDGDDIVTIVILNLENDKNWRLVIKRIPKNL